MVTIRVVIRSMWFAYHKLNANMEFKNHNTIRNWNHFFRIKMKIEKQNTHKQVAFTICWLFFVVNWMFFFFFFGVWINRQNVDDNCTEIVILAFAFVLVGFWLFYFESVML